MGRATDQVMTSHRLMGLTPKAKDYDRIITPRIAARNGYLCPLRVMNAAKPVLALSRLNPPTVDVGWPAVESLLYCLAASTIFGRRIVKVDPRPGSLATVMSPPII